MTTATGAYLVPLFYLCGLAALFAGFVSWARGRQRVKQLHDLSTGYFPAHTAKLTYLELAEMFSPDEPTGQKLLTVALMKRAVENVRRAWKIRDEKPPLQNLVRQGVVGEDLWDKLCKAEAELDVEVQEVVEEAELYKPGWGKSIFQEASQLAQMQMQRDAQMAAQQAAQENAELEARLEGGADDASPSDPTPTSRPRADSTASSNGPVETDEEKRQ
ncbi:translocation protein S66, partial [Borealophlyctis nickersoniae]